MIPIRLEKLGKQYGTATAVDSVDLQIPGGSLFFLLGSSGCGKTTILRMIAGFIEPTHGRVWFGDRDVTALPAEKRGCGMVFQSYALWPHMSVAENVAFGLEVRKIAQPERKRRTEEALEMVHMAAYSHRKPVELSGGQQQRVALARAIVFRPEVLLLDEPLSNLDAKLRLQMRSEIKRICNALGMTAVYVTHDQEEALSMADNMVVMDHGRIVQAGAPRELYERPRTKFIADFLGETNFLETKVARCSGKGGLLETGVGALECSDVLGATVGSKRVISIRNESWAIVECASGKDGGSDDCRELAQDGRCSDGESSTVSGKCTATTYLGSTAQHTVQVGDCVLRVREQSPRHENRAGQQLQLRCLSAKVVMLEQATLPSTASGSA